MPVALPIGTAAFPSGVPPVPPPSPGEPSYSASFETGSGTEGSAAFPECLGLIEAATGRISRVTSVDGQPPPEGSYCAKVSCQDGDTWTGVDRERSWLVPLSLASLFGGDSLEGKELWFAWDMYYQSSNPIPLINDVVFGIAPSLDLADFAGYPPTINNVAVRVAVDRNLNIDCTGGTAIDNTHGVSIGVSPLLDQWFSMKMHLLFSSQGTATAHGPSINEVWRNDVRLDAGLLNGFPNLFAWMAYTPAVFFGVMRYNPNTSIGTTDVYVDHFRIAASEAALGD